MKSLILFFSLLIVITSLPLYSQVDNSSSEQKNSGADGKKSPPSQSRPLPRIPVIKNRPRPNAISNLKNSGEGGNSEYDKEKINITAPQTVLASEKGIKKAKYLYANLEVAYVFQRKKKIGKIRIKLHQVRAPNTVSNFVDLAEGKKEFIDPKTKKEVKRPFYDGLTFHRVVKNFLIQGGCPKGDGSSGPGYKFKDEFHPELLHNRPGVVSMANSGPNSNGSQFFILLQPTKDLDKKNTVFGQVIDGMNVVEEISQVKVNRINNKPRRKVILKSVKIERVY